TGACELGVLISFVCLSLVCHHRFMIICRSFPFFKSYSACRTCRQAIAKTVAIVFTQKLCFSVNHADSAFMTCVCTCSASVALFFIYVNNLSYHRFSPQV